MQKIHQSWFVVAGCVGVIFGAVVGVLFGVKFIISPLFIVLAVILFAICLVKPLNLF